MLKLEDIRIRDPFIYTDYENKCYYMYGTTDLADGSISAYNSYSVYKSYDLENFEEPKVLFDGDEYPDFWGKYDFWAPEMHAYNGKYYLLGSCKAKDKCRGTQIFVCDTPDGKFVPVSPNPATPLDWECLDGTFYVENGKPYMIFSHEWLQVHDGEICAVELSTDLTHAVTKPTLLFHASDSPIVSESSPGNYVTDGPFLYLDNGQLKMIWSSFCNGRYLVLSAKSDSVCGKWIHEGSLFDFDGGHAMIFHTLDGRRMISLHSPNTAGLERAKFIEF
ncbi:MAG: family 43 glycosylhydrolase [Clostridia bacterium]|nr:family 43 glycosylhydrolase [Clostridia bacterium]